MRMFIRTGRAVAALAACLVVPLAVVVAAPDPASASSHMEGYVWANQPATPFYVATGYEYSSSGQPIEITRTGPGAYTVRFRELASAGGVAQVSSYGNGNLCTLASYQPTRDNALELRVRCFDGNGLPSDSRFAAHFTDQHSVPAGAYFAYLRSDDPNPRGGSYQPPAQWSYDSTGEPSVVTQVREGVYLVHLGALAASFPTPYWDGFFRATAYGSDPARCEVTDPFSVLPDHDLPVSCYGPDGDPVDSAFTLTYAQGVNVLGSPTTHTTVMAKPQPAGADPFVVGWSSPGGKPTAARLGTGDYLVLFPGVGTPFGHAIASVQGHVSLPQGDPRRYCSIAGWAAFGTDQLVRVNCWWNTAGTIVPRDVWAFNVAFTH